jgi:membrane-associated phospholipid phosphatase
MKRVGAFLRNRTAVWMLGVLPCLMAGVDLQASDGVRKTGDVFQYLLPATAAGLTIGFKDREGALQFGKAALLTGGLTLLLKLTIDERRPDGGRQSFPSGHTSISFVSAEFLRRRYGWKIALPVYAAAVFVGYSRVESKRHYVHDVVAGAAIGMGSSWLFTRHDDRPHQ